MLKKHSVTFQISKILQIQKFFSITRIILFFTVGQNNLGDKISFVCLFFLLFDKKYFLTASSAHAVLNITLLMLYLISRFVKFLLICMLFDKFYQIISKQTKFWIQLNPIGLNYIKLDKTGFNCFKIYQIALFVLNFKSNLKIS